MPNNRKNIVLVTKDVLRRDYLRCYNPNSIFNTKNIDKLAKKGCIFDNFYASAASTGMATTCMFSGLSAFQLERKSFREVNQFTQTKTLFSLLEDEGVSTHVIWSYEFEEMGYAYSKVFDEATNIHYAPPGGSCETTPQKRAFKGKGDSYDLPDYFFQFIKKISDESSGRFFIWCHCPHVFQPRTSYGSDIDLFDSLIGRLDNEIDAELIVAADHGHMLCEKGKITYGFDLYDGIVKIPLITPNYFGSSTVEFPVEQSQLKEILFSKKLVKKEFIYSDTQYYEQKNRKLMILKGQMKYIFNKIDQSEELYDLKFDPSENINLLVDYWPDLERNTAYKLDEVVYYNDWSKAKEYYYLLRQEKDKIWRQGSFLSEFISDIKSRFANRRKAGLINSFKSRSKKLYVDGKWGSRARINL